MKTKLPKATKERWDKVTKKDLYELAFKQNLADSIIADMYGVPNSAVTYKRAVKFKLKYYLGSEAMRRSIRDNALEEINKGCFSVKEKKIIADCIIKACGDLPVEEWEK